jgi:hypothetical protein
MGLRIFAITYTTITLIFFLNIYSDQSASLGYALMFPWLWTIGAILLGGLLYWQKITIKSKSDWVTLTFATPIPTFLFMFIGFSMTERPASTYEYGKGGHRHRIVTYEYKNGQTKRTEFYKSKDTVTEENPFPTSDTWIKDSVWVYYDTDGQIEKTEDYQKQ